MTTPSDERADPLRASSSTEAGNTSEGSQGTVVADDSHPLRPSTTGTTNNSNNQHKHNNNNMQPPFDPLRLNVNMSRDNDSQYRDQKSPSQTREEAHRFDDELRLLQIERQISEANNPQGKDANGTPLDKTRSASMRRARTRAEDVVDEFDIATNPLHERNQIYKPPENPKSKLSKFFKRVHNSSFLVRYITYITPVVLILLIPLLIGALVPGAKSSYVGGVELLWFMIWLEIVWLTLWLGRIIAKALPYPAGLIASLFTNNSKKWRDLVKQLELAATLFFWWLAIEISFLPTMVHHQQGGTTVRDWQKQMNKVLIAFLVAATLNFIEKVLIQLIAISFHQRTYQDRIETNKFEIASLVKLYSYSKVKLNELDDSEFEDRDPGSGARTPGAVLKEAQKNTQKAINQFGDVAGKIAGDFTGRTVKASTHPSQVTVTLLSTPQGSQVLARRLYRTYKKDDAEVISAEDLEQAFDNKDECDSAFNMFDKDLNGDISMEELELVCVEIGRERKAITASLKDLDSVVSKLDNVFMFVVVVIAVLVLIALISSAAAAGLSNAGSVVLGLSWLFSTTATEFLQSIIFVFVKHPFDVGDRVTIYGQTGATYKGDDYFVKEIALLYTEFKKMEGHVVQAPNSYLNTLFILNQRRSGGLAEAVPMTFKFGTTIEQIDNLRQKLLDFVRAEKREYQGNILTELRDVVEAHAISLNVIFFFKSNWQNELLRLQRRNKFICALMIAIQECGIEGPRMRYPGQKDTFPLYMQSMPFNPEMRGRGGTPDNPSGDYPVNQRENNDFSDPAFVPVDGQVSSEAPRRPSVVFDPRTRGASISARSGDGGRHRGESIAQQSKRYDFSFGASEMSAGNMTGDVYDDVPRPIVPVHVQSPSQSRMRQSSRESRENRERASMDIGRSTARSNTVGPHFLNRATTDGPRHSGSVHRNRFFPRYSRESQRPEEYRMEAGMAGIPEGEGSGTTSRMDPRSGMVSPMAMRFQSNESSALPEMTDNGSSIIPFPRTSMSSGTVVTGPAPGLSRSGDSDR